MRIQISGYNRTTSSLYPNGSSSNGVGRGGRGVLRAALIRVFFASTLVLGTSVGVARTATAQTPTTPPAEQGQQPAETQPSQPPTPQPPPQQIPLQQFPIQQPGRPLITPATPPSTTIPPWTPPVPPPPSQ